MGDKVRKLVEYHESRIRENAPQQAPAPPSNAQQHERLARQGPGKLERKDFWKDLEGKLGETGRVDPNSPESLAKREQWSGTILRGMEESTRERQKAEGAPSLAHGVLGHGPGTDQVSRLVHGRRNDEIVEDRDSGTAPTTHVSLTGNPHGIDDATVEAYGQVGSDPNDKSGAFTSNVGMLHVVESAFSQASMLSADPDAQRKIGKSSLQDDRFATTVSGPKGGIGYTLEMDDPSMPKLQTGDALSASDMQERFRHVKRTDGLEYATVVLDPAFIDGKRSGWQMQTAFAHDQAPTTRLDSPDDVASYVGPRVAIKQADFEVQEAKARLDEAQKEQKKNHALVDAISNKALPGLRKGLDAKKKALEKATEPEAQAKAQEALDAQQAKLDAKQRELDEAIHRAPELDAKIKSAEAALALAEAKRGALESP